MGATLLPFLAGTVALLRAFVEWRQRPRGAGALVFEYAALAAVNFGLLVAESRDPWTRGGASSAVGLVLFAPPFLRSLAATQLRIGRPGPMRWMLLLRFAIAWHRQHLLDVLYLPVRLLRARGELDAAVELCHRLSGNALIRGLEPEQAEELAATLLSGQRYAQICAEPAIQEAAQVHGPVAVALAVGRAETGDAHGAAEALARAADLGAPPIHVHIGWARLLAASGREAEFDRWVRVGGLDEAPETAALIPRLRARAAQAPAGVVEEPPEPPYERLVAQRVDQAVVQRLDVSGPATRLCFWTIAVVWLWQLWAGTQSDPSIVAEAGAVVPPLLLAHQWWRAIAASLLHGGWLHVLMNAMAIGIIGPRTEALIGGRLFIFVWVVSAIGGAVGSCIGDVTMSVGASGAIMGLVGCYVGVLLRRPPDLPESVRRGQITIMVLIVALQFGYGLAEPVLDDGGHLGGLVAGFLAGLVIPPAGARRGPLGLGWLAAAAAAGAAGILSIAVAVFAALGGGTLDPARLPSQVLDLTPDLRVSVPTWWEGNTKAPGEVADPKLGVTAVIRRGTGTVQLPEALEREIKGLESHLEGAPLVHATVKLGTGVLRRDADVDVRPGDGQGVLRYRLSYYAAVRDGRHATVRVFGPRGSMRLLQAILDDLAAQVTPGQ